MLNIQTANLSSRKRVLIDGHEYTVRKLGAGDELALSQIIRETQSMIKQAEKNGELMPEEEAKFVKMQEDSLKIYAGTFDDGGDGSKAYELVSSLSYIERKLLYSQIFDEPEEVANADSNES